VGGKKEMPHYFLKKYCMIVFLVYTSFTTKIMEQILNNEDLIQKLWKCFY